jgi:hypothetical protein
MTHYPILMGAGPFGPSYLFNEARFSNTHSSTFAFSAVDFNSDSPDRLVIVAVHWYKYDTTAGISTISVGGVPATLVRASSRLVGAGSYIYSSLYRVQPSGSSGTINLQFSSGVEAGCSVATWSAYNLSSIIPATSAGGIPSQSVATQTGDVVIACATGLTFLNSTWTGVTEDYDQFNVSGSGLSRTGAATVATTTGSLSVGVSAADSGPMTMVAAVWR